MLEEIENWIHEINARHETERVSCTFFKLEFQGFYSPIFLESAYFVVTDHIPKPNFPRLRQAGLGGFIDMDVAGITYNDTYYVKTSAAKELRLHFHELVHVIQWRTLTPQGFIRRYIQEIHDLGYYEAPLEKMAYALDAHYQAKGQNLDIEKYVREHL